MRNGTNIIFDIFPRKNVSDMQKTIVITGSTRGIGFQLAKNFLEQGHTVIINGRSEQSVKSALDKLQGKVYGIAGDVRELNTIEKLIDLAVKNSGKIDIWINNAALPQDYKLFTQLEDSQIEALIDTNLKALMIATKHVANHMLSQGYGQIYNFNGFGSDGMKKQRLTLYGTTKCAVNYFSQAINKELQGTKVKVGTIQPGMTDTDFLVHGMNGATDEEIEYMKKVNAIMAEPVDKVALYISQKVLEGKQDISYINPWRIMQKVLKLKLKGLG